MHLQVRHNKDDNVHQQNNNRRGKSFKKIHRVQFNSRGKIIGISVQGDGVVLIFVWFRLPSSSPRTVPKVERERDQIKYICLMKAFQNPMARNSIITLVFFILTSACTHRVSKFYPEFIPKKFEATLTLKPTGTQTLNILYLGCGNLILEKDDEAILTDP